ncbi:MAG: class I SAM-dependent methyltransferase, partial [candidate division Zixibacteria bacterium]|nr:class I SAM-dependent methyltransferase [candidate division Zixibacteria bacterium]
RFAFYRPDVVFFRHSIERELAGFFRKTGNLDLAEKKILDVGCGWGSWLLLFLSWGVRPENLCGIDLLPERVEVARQRLPKSEIALGQAEKLPWPDGSFDIVLQFTLFSSILPAQAREEAAREIWRVLKTDGHFVSFDFFISNPTNPNTVGIGKGELRRLFPKAAFEFRRVGLFPPLARRLAPVSISLTQFLEKTRVLSGHYLAWSIKKQEAGGKL